MRLTKGKFKKLLKKKNQTKRNKRPLKTLKSNKTLKPKKKIFDLSKKTFKNRQLYGGVRNTKWGGIKIPDPGEIGYVNYIVSQLDTAVSRSTSTSNPKATPSSAQPTQQTTALPQQATPSSAQPTQQNTASTQQAPPSSAQPTLLPEQFANIMSVPIPPDHTTEINLKFETIEYTKFLKDIESQTPTYNTELTKNVVEYIKTYMDVMKTQDYFYDTAVGEYKISYLYTQENGIKNIYFTMFYYKNNFGEMKNILQCLFMYDTIIFNKMTDCIINISNKTLNKEFITDPTDPHPHPPCILFYANITTFINDNIYNSLANITKYASNTTQYNGFISNEYNNNNNNNNNYKYLLYFKTGKIQFTTLDGVINIINKILTSKISK